jgi:SsrA-binding protein
MPGFLLHFPVEILIITRRPQYDAMSKEESDQKILTTNRKARHEFFIDDTFEAGIVLRGTEVKSLRLGNANLQDSYAVISKGEVWLIGMQISPFEKGNINNHDPKRDRKLLLHRREILRLYGRIQEKGLTLVPLSIYLKKNLVKVQIGIARGKKLYDKRESIARRETERQIRRDYAR